MVADDISTVVDYVSLSDGFILLNDSYFIFIYCCCCYVNILFICAFCALHVGIIFLIFIQMLCMLP